MKIHTYHSYVINNLCWNLAFCASAQHNMAHRAPPLKAKRSFFFLRRCSWHCINTTIWINDTNLLSDRLKNWLTNGKDLWKPHSKIHCCNSTQNDDKNGSAFSFLNNSLWIWWPFLCVASPCWRFVSLGINVCFCFVLLTIAIHTAQVHKVYEMGQPYNDQKSHNMNKEELICVRTTTTTTTKTKIHHHNNNRLVTGVFFVFASFRYHFRNKIIKFMDFILLSAHFYFFGKIVVVVVTQWLDPIEGEVCQNSENKKKVLLLKSLVKCLYTNCVCLVNV